MVNSTTRSQALSDHDQTMRKAADAAAAAVHDDIDLAVKELEDQLIAVPVDPGSLDVASPESGTGRTPIDHGIGCHGIRCRQNQVVDPRATTPWNPSRRNADATDARFCGATTATRGRRVTDGLRSRPVREVAFRGALSPPEAVHPGGGGSGPVGGHEELDQVGAPTASVGAIGVATLTEVRDVEASADDSPGDVGSPLEVARSTGTRSPGETSVPEESDVEPRVDVTGGDTLAGVVPEAQTDADASTGHENGLQTVLDRRDELLEPAEKLLGRALKRLLSDEQNEVLDRVRRHKRSRIEVADLLGEQDATEGFTSKLSDPYATAAVAGAKMWAELSGDDSGEPTEIDTTAAVVTDSLESQVDELLGLRRAQLREVLEAHSEAGADPGELVDRLRSAYRDLRTSSVDELAGDLATGGFAAGTAVAAGPSAMWRWVPDNGGLPCADAEDNALEGPVACGAAFPTGDARPPAHPGCRCVVVPAEVEVHQ